MNNDTPPVACLAEANLATFCEPPAERTPSRLAGTAAQPMTAQERLPSAAAGMDPPRAKLPTLSARPGVSLRASGRGNRAGYSGARSFRGGGSAGIRSALAASDVGRIVHQKAAGCQRCAEPIAATGAI